MKQWLFDKLTGELEERFVPLYVEIDNLLKVSDENERELFIYIIWSLIDRWKK